MKMGSKDQIVSLLEKAGITVNGTEDHDMQVHNDRLYRRVVRDGSLGLGESYMDGWWDSESLDETIAKILRAELDREFHLTIPMIYERAKGLFLNSAWLQKFKIGEHHYDIGNDLFERMLDPTLAYTCGYWDTADTLEEAQHDKLDLICRKLRIRSGDRVLDIGSGWGSFINYAAEHYGAHCLGISVSREQVEFSNNNKNGLPVESRYVPYQEFDGMFEGTVGEFDHVVSVGMFEHVCYKNYPDFMKKVHDLLSHDGTLLLHTIGGRRSVRANEPWISRYIFPNSMLPSASQISSAAENLFVMEDWHNFGADYDLTLMEWFKNFHDAWPDLEAKYGGMWDGRFYRMWKYYLLSCAGSFRARKNQLWQIVFSKHGEPGGYTTVR